MSLPLSLFAFDGSRRIAAGSYLDVAMKVSTYLLGRPDAQPLLFDADTGKQVDVDLRVSPERSATRDESNQADAPKAGKGRPKLGVTAREVTLLPRHWDWLAAQPGGASVTLRKLVERAMKDPDSKLQQQARSTAAYHFMHAVAGNLPGFEQASRLLFAGDLGGLRLLIAQWPGDIAEQVMLMAGQENK